MVTISQLMTRHLVQIEAGTSAIEAAKLSSGPSQKPPT